MSAIDSLFSLADSKKLLRRPRKRRKTIRNALASPMSLTPVKSSFQKLRRRKLRSSRPTSLERLSLLESTKSLLPKQNKKRRRIRKRRKQTNPSQKHFPWQSTILPWLYAEPDQIHRSSHWCMLCHSWHLRLPPECIAS